MAASRLDLYSHFDAVMTALGPFEPRARFAAAVSGGADSMALALLAHRFATERDGALLALIIDHGLRADSARESADTATRLAGMGIASRVLLARDLSKGPALAERARAARYGLLTEACAAAGIVHLLAGHHRGDQVETLMMRVLSGSATLGLAGMPALMETAAVRLLRPLLDVPPQMLRDFLTGLGVGWVEDPSNRDPAALRARLRLGRADPAGNGEGTWAMAQAARMAGAHRAARDEAIARALAARISIRPEGFAILPRGPIDPDALAAVMRVIAGAPYAPPIDRVAALARAPGPATLGGTRILPAGRHGPGWLLVREARALRPAVAARHGAIWDGRFRLTGAPFGIDLTEAGLRFGALGSGAARYRVLRGPPTVVLHGLPAVCRDDIVIAIPHLGFGDPAWRVVFNPPSPMAGAPFVVGQPQ